MFESDPDSLTGHALASQAVSTALLGPLVMGWALHLILYGIVISCFSRYWTSELYQRDPKRVKVALWIVFGLTTAAVVSNVEQLFQAGVRQNRSTEEILAGTLGSSFEPLLSGTTALAVHLFLARRTINLFESRLVKTVYSAGILLLIVGSYTGCLMVTGLGFMYYNGTIDDALPLTFNASTGIWLCLSAATDVAISLGLLWNLRLHLRGFNEATDSVLKKIIFLALRTAAFTTVFALAGAISGISIAEDNLQATDVPYVFWLPMPSLYALSIFSTLSARKGLRNAVAVNRVGGYTSTRLEYGGQQSYRAPVEIRVERNVEIRTEEEEKGEVTL